MKRPLILIGAAITFLFTTGYNVKKEHLISGRTMGTTYHIKMVAGDVESISGLKGKIDDRLKGTFNIDSKFSYIDQNERKSVSIISDPIVILPSPTIDPELIVDIEDFEDNVIPYIGGEEEKIGKAGWQQISARLTRDLLEYTF